MELLERGPLLGRLGELLRDAAQLKGRLVLVAGEAGVGKTALVDAFCAANAAEAHVLRGACDAVVPARPFAPVSDIAVVVGEPLQSALAASERHRVFESFLGLLREPAPSIRVVVFDDLHWADDATLDLLRVLGRRAHELRALVIGTYRNDEVSSSHPLRLALGDVTAPPVLELEVPPLTLDAVRALAAGTGTDAAVLHEVTAGNPFFVTEVLTAVGDDVPVTIRDAVLARAARLSAAARHVLAAASILGRRFEPALLCDVAGSDAGPIEECLARGMLQFDGEVLRFRHELAQRSVARALPPAERVALHTRALIALRTHRGVSPAQLAHHAVAAGDSRAVLELARVAGDQAAGLGAHREAAAQYSAALSNAGALDDRSRAELLERHAGECLLIDVLERAIASQQEALGIWRELGDLRREGDCLRALSLMTWFDGDGNRAIELVHQAVDVLESTSPPGSELARAYAALGQRHFTAGHRLADIVPWCERALALAEDLGCEQVAAHALTTMGAAQVYSGNHAGLGLLEDSLRRAGAAGLEDDVARALINLVEAGRDVRRYDIVDRYREAALAYMSEDARDLDIYRRRLSGALADIALERGEWEEATDRAEGLVRSTRTAAVTRARGFAVLGRCRARRGHGDAWFALDEALGLLGPRGEWQDLSVVRAARAEAAWLDGNEALAGAEALAGLALVRDDDDSDPWFRGELGYWAWQSDCLERIPEDAAEPYMLLWEGENRRAAELWAAIGAPYQQALALAAGDEEAELREALLIFQALAARPMALRTAARLRHLGARGIPRGPRAAAQRNPAGLTGRELEVLVLLGEQLTNADIARRLVLSPKTVDHHVSAILRKLDVSNRAAAAAKAAQLGLEDGDVSLSR